ncbi:PQ loop repeat-domain-containing protein [Boletus edulis]|nr:PQ loop repeat-domain-containing protein [Boletus edulis]
MFLVESVSDFLGYTSICCWLGAQFPQILENIRQQSCESLALPFLFNWMLGDASNLIGCILTHQLPFQTYLATYFCVVDCCLLYQYFYYSGSPETPITYPHTRSRATSSARRLSIDASHYRTLSATAGNIATAAALAAHSEHRYPKKLGDFLVDEHITTQYPYEEPQGEVSDAVPSALSESFYSESGRRKRVSWSRERQDPPPGGSLRRHMSPVVPATLRHTPAAAAAALVARGRPLRREEDEDEEDVSEEQMVEAERRNTSRASRRSAGMVLLGMGVLFGIGRYTGDTQPLIGRRAKTGAVLVSTSNLNIPLSGLPVAENPSKHLTDTTPFSFDVELPSLPNDSGFNQSRQPDEDTNYERIVGRIFAWTCTTLYLTSRLPQIWKNYVRKSVEGLSMYLFVFAFLGNFFYVLSIVTSPKAHLPPPASTEFLGESLPYLLGSGGTFMFDITIVSQSFIYKGKHPRRSYIRSRGNSLVRSAALAEETAGLLRGDMLAAARARSEWAHADIAAVPRSQSRS